MIVVTGLCDLVKTVVNDSSEVPNYQIISPIVLLLSAVSVCGYIYVVSVHRSVCYLMVSPYCHAKSIYYCVCVGTNDGSDTK